MPRASSAGSRAVRALGRQDAWAVLSPSPPGSGPPPGQAALPPAASSAATTVRGSPLHRYQQVLLTAPPFPGRGLGRGLPGAAGFFHANDPCSLYYEAAKYTK